MDLEIPARPMRIRLLSIAALLALAPPAVQASTIASCPSHDEAALERVAREVKAIAAAAGAKPLAPPAVLYHWTTLWNMKTRWAKEIHSEHHFTLKKIGPDFIVASAYPALAKHAGLYGWTNPLTAIGATSGEIYGGMASDGAALVRLDIDPLARAIEIDSEDGKPVAKHFDPSKVDLVLHKWKQDGKVVLQEWILLNPKVVTGYTGDPRTIAPELRPQIKRLVANDRFRTSERHWLGDDAAIKASRPFVVDMAKSFLRHRDEVPAEFRR